MKTELLNRRQLEAGRRFSERHAQRRAQFRRIEKGKATPVEFDSPDLPVRELQIGRFGDVYGYARLLGESAWVPTSFLERGVAAAQSVARLSIRSRYGEDEGYATGFLVSPGVLLTTWSVMPSSFSARYSLAEFSLEADLRGGPRFPVTFELDPETLFVSNEKLDFAIVALAGESFSGISATQIPALTPAPEVSRVLVGEYVTLIDHPGGRAKQIALRAHRVLDALDDFYHYGLSESASPGAPVFNDDWDLVGLQRLSIPRVDDKGRPVSRSEAPIESPDQIAWEATEATRLSCIADCLREVSLDEEQTALLQPLLARPSATPFSNFDGYQVDHLGAEFAVFPPMIPLRRSLNAWRSPQGTAELRYPHFSLVGDRVQRHAIYVALNLGAESWLFPDEVALLQPDPRLPEAEQVSDDALDQHAALNLVRARDVSWGPNAELRADGAAYRPVVSLAARATGLDKWDRHADAILRRTVGEQKRATVLAGPVDAEGNIAVPNEFWRIVVQIENQRLAARAYLFTTLDALGRAVGSWRLFECSVEALQGRTGLDFGILVEHDARWGQPDYFRLVPSAELK